MNKPNFEVVATDGKLFWLLGDGIVVETVEYITDCPEYKWGGEIADKDSEDKLLDLVFVWLTEGREFKASYIDGELDYEYPGKDKGVYSEGDVKPGPTDEEKALQEMTKWISRVQKTGSIYIGG